uniref:Uncharacterized protein n=1 Tax=virus sp. ctBS918 TaxID=2825807 RepID=A0A8S5RPH0_9VIRU|nr:MAG TPA: hypothetical protein [virus sp. ctBS918]
MCPCEPTSHCVIRLHMSFLQWVDNYPHSTL